MADNHGTEFYKIENIYESGEQFIGDVLYEINKAQKTVEFETFIFEESHVGRTVLRALSLAVSRGVKVNLLVDGVGSLSHISWLSEQCSTSKIDFRVFHPLNNRFQFFSWNKRNHRKTIIIDGMLAFIGSINIAKVHFSSEVSNPWVDLALKASGSSIETLQLAFQKAWIEEGPDIKTLLPMGLRSLPNSILNSLSGIKWRVNNYLILRFFFWRDLLRRIRSAKTRIWIMNAYFVPHRTLMRSLVKASESGAMVNIILPSRSDVPITKWVAPAVYRYLLKKNIKIFEFSKTMLHTKTLLIDDWGLIGSHNLNYRSLIHDLEVEAVIEDSEYIKKMEEIYLQVMNQAKEVTLRDIANLSWWDWLKCRFVLLFRYLL
jgi:cardiolipin synthase